MKGPIIVVLAAGMGSRYGGLKQMDSVGKNGEVLLDYSVFDAARSGFEKAVFIIRHDIEKDFKELILGRIAASMAASMAAKFPCELAFQEMDSLIPETFLAEARRANRTKPWGTAHALLCAESLIDAPFAIINADDFYGREAFDAIGKYLCTDPVTEGAIVPYRLEKTLSPQGTVTRGVCTVDGAYLSSVDELKAIAKESDGRIYNTLDGVKQELAAATPVSMNFWAFPKTIFPALRSYFDEFLKTQAHEPKSECYLPMAADWFIKNQLLKIRVLEADSPWFGVTYKEDRESAIRRVAGLTREGVYPEKLWG